MPLAAGFGDGSRVPNEANRLNRFESSPGAGGVGDGQYSAGFVNSRGSAYTAGAIFTAARCS